jgi:hypothetical protein
VADRDGKGKKKAKEQASVLGSLPSTRPNRIGRERGAPAKSPPAVAKRKAPTAKRTPAHATPNPAPHAEPRGPRPVRSGAPTLPDPPAPEDRQEPNTAGPSGTELVTTVVQAAGELSKIGLTVGGQVLKRAVQKLPKP